MAEQVNQRIEDMINELEQMRRTNLFDDEEIKEISRKRKEFEYKVQRRVKQKEDYVQYIAYELALLENITLRRKQAKLGEKRSDIEFAIAKRLNKLFKNFIYRFQNHIEIYFEYIKFCRSIGFDHAISGIIEQMLQIHGDKPNVWLMASKWESQEQSNYDAARNLLLKGIHRHPESDILYMELFEIELNLAFKADENEEKEKILKRASIVWQNGVKNVTNDVTFLFKICDLALKFDVDSITGDIKKAIWSKRGQKEVWSYIASKELEACHWQEIEEFFDDETNFSKELNYFIAVYEEGLQQFPDKNLCTKYIHDLLGVNERVCTDIQKIRAVKHAWTYGLENGLLTNDMYTFGIEVLKLENEMTNEELMKILDTAIKTNPQARYIWEQKLQLVKPNEKKILSIVEEATKFLKSEDVLCLWNWTLDNMNSKVMLQNLYKKFQNCESSVLLAIKPKLLQKMYEHIGLTAAREMYEEFIRTPPTQMEVHKVMIDIEKCQEKLNTKYITKCYECSVQHHGKDDTEVWMEYMKFENESGNVQASPAIYRRAIATLNKELVDEFIKAQTLARLK